MKEFRLDCWINQIVCITERQKLQELPVRPLLHPALLLEQKAFLRHLLEVSFQDRLPLDPMVPDQV